MQRLTFFILALSLAAAVNSVPAQGPPGGFDPGRMFEMNDANRNGRIDREEIENNSRLRDRLREQGIDTRNGLSRDDYVRVMERAMSSGGFRGPSSGSGDGGFRGPPGGGEGFRMFSGGGEGFRGPPGGGEGFRGPPGSSSGGGPPFGSYGDRGRDEGRSSDGDRSRYGYGSSGSSNYGSSGYSREGGYDRGRDSSRSSSQSAPRAKVTLELPAIYASGDTDYDGQIGLYEWIQWKGRATLPEFNQLDANGDGFVSPYEIATAGSRPAGTTTTLMASTPTPSASPAAGTAVTVAPPAAAPTSTTNTTIAAASTAVAIDLSTPIDEGNADVKRYRTFFKLLDKDHDGTISLQEWDASRQIRQKFSDAGITLQPMDGDTFVRYHLHVDAKGTRKS